MNSLRHFEKHRRRIAIAAYVTHNNDLSKSFKGQAQIKAWQSRALPAVQRPAAPAKPRQGERSNSHSRCPTAGVRKHRLSQIPGLHFQPRMPNSHHHRVQRVCSSMALLICGHAYPPRPGASPPHAPCRRRRSRFISPG